MLNQLIRLDSNSDNIQRIWNTFRRYKVIINERANWQADLNPDQFNEVWYSDGSKKENSTGVGWCDRMGHTEKSLRISDHATIMQAETLGIELCAREMLNASPGRKLLILSDSQAALKALENPITRSKTTEKCARNLNILAANSEVTLGWIPGHSSHAGNETADRLANEGADKESIELEIPEATSSRANKILQWLKAEKEKEWHYKRPDNGHYAHTLIEGLGPGKGKPITNKRRAQIRARMGILTGHARTNKYMSRTDADKSSLCRFCNSSQEKVEHLIMSCHRLDHIRYDTLRTHKLNVNQLKSVMLEDLVRFSKEAGFYDLLACDHPK